MASAVEGKRAAEKPTRVTVTAVRTTGGSACGDTGWGRREGGGVLEGEGEEGRGRGRAG